MEAAQSLLPSSQLRQGKLPPPPYIAQNRQYSAVLNPHLSELTVPTEVLEELALRTLNYRHREVAVPPILGKSGGLRLAFPGRH